MQICWFLSFGFRGLHLFFTILESVFPLTDYWNFLHRLCNEFILLKVFDLHSLLSPQTLHLLLLKSFFFVSEFSSSIVFFYCVADFFKEREKNSWGVKKDEYQRTDCFTVYETASEAGKSNHFTYIYICFLPSLL